ncbi:heavy-metal-associated domain-containing protein [Streptomyces sp. NPDC091377]|uniref:heavy-metal-associated domain-containing protein n=1 Tax=unclassified Streptomyces TaxID=2593676 RepID=UPI003804B1F6
MTQEQKRYGVTGMSCAHCAAGITQRVSEVPGVSEVVVDVDAKSVTVHGTGLDDRLLRDAITEAGFGVADTVTT